MTNPAPTTLRPWLSTRQAANIVGVDTAFIRGEVADGRLKGYTIKRPNKRALYRVRRSDFELYLRTRWKRAGS